MEFLLQGGNIFFDLAIHDVDFIRWALQDEVESVFAATSYSSEQLKAHGIHDNATMVLKFSKGTLMFKVEGWKYASEKLKAVFVKLTSLLFSSCLFAIQARL